MSVDVPTKCTVPTWLGGAPLKDKAQAQKERATPREQGKDEKKRGVDRSMHFKSEALVHGCTSSATNLSMTLVGYGLEIEITMYMNI
ncbi:hypothetical protein ACLOJK_006543 [Asimina triloba]